MKGVQDSGRCHKDFKEEGIQKVAPCHCSGDLTRKLFKKAYGEDFIAAGMGKKIVVKV